MTQISSLSMHHFVFQVEVEKNRREQAGVLPFKSQALYHCESIAIACIEQKNNII